MPDGLEKSVAEIVPSLRAYSLHLSSPLIASASILIVRGVESFESLVMDTGAALCEYELERDRRISRNLEVLRGLGLAIGASDGLHTKLSSYTLPQAAPPLKRPKLHKLVEVRSPKTI